MADTVWAVEVRRRTITAAVRGEQFEVLWRYYRRRWVAKLVAWWINTLGPGPDYEAARFLGETF